MPRRTANETHDETIARLWAEIEDERRAELARLYAPPQDPNAPMPWKSDGNGGEFMEVAPTANGLRIHGLATTPTIDSHSSVLASKDMEAKLPVPLYDEHKTKGAEPLGEVYYLWKSPAGIYMRAAFFDHLAARFAEELIKARKKSCLSVGPAREGYRLLGEVAGVKFFDRWRLKEISICTQGANPDCRFELLRPGGTHKQFIGDQVRQTAEPDIPYSGVWNAGSSYKRGQFVTKAGALWHANVDSQGIEPGTAPACWTLAVKRGHAERLEK